MKQFTGFEDAKKQAQYNPAEKLPAGGYVCKVMAVKYQNGENGNSDSITLQFDIEEGEQKGFFKKQYDANTQEDKKYKGVIRIYVPKDDGSEQDGWTKTNFARWTDAFEKSNAGYVWNWDEQTFKGKLIGITFGETGTVIDGREITYTEARSCDSVENIRTGKFYAQKFKAKNGYTGNGNNAAATTSTDSFVNIPKEVDAEEIPF